MSGRHDKNLVQTQISVYCNSIKLATGNIKTQC